jgi:two-component system NtrC family sensor kinase
MSPLKVVFVEKNDIIKEIGQISVYQEGPVEEEIKILCVDDEPNVLSAIKRLLLDEKYTILTAESGEEGLAILRNAKVQLIIADYRMPVMTGIEFLQEVRKYWPDTIRIVLSGYADTASIVEAINEGRIYKFIPKPWNDDELRIAISNALETYFFAKKNTQLTDELRKQHKELEKLLREKNENLELRARMVTAHQNILDSISVGFLGIDLDNDIIQCNVKWEQISGSNKGHYLSRNADEVLPDQVLRFIEEVKQNSKASAKCEIYGTMCYMLGSYMLINKQKGIILSFIREDDISRARCC